MVVVSEVACMRSFTAYQPAETRTETCWTIEVWVTPGARREEKQGSSRTVRSEERNAIDCCSRVAKQESVATAVDPSESAGWALSGVIWTQYLDLATFVKLPRKPDGLLSTSVLTVQFE